MSFFLIGVEGIDVMTTAKALKAAKAAKAQAAAGNAYAGTAESQPVLHVETDGHKTRIITRV